MAEINDLNVSDSLNVDRMPEAQAPSSVNDGVRALEGLLARGLKDTIDGVITTTGTSTAYVAASNRTLTAYYAGLELTLKFNVASGASPTLNVDAIGTANLVWPDGTAIAANDIPADGIGIVKHDGTSFQVISRFLVPYGDPLTTRGDLVYRDASSTTRLAVGAANTVLRSDGTDAAWGQVASGNIAANAVNGTHIAMTSDAQGDVLYYDGTNYVRLGAGTDGQFLQTQGAGANPQWASSTFPPPDYESAEQTVTADTRLQLEHGLGATPSFYQVIGRCKATDNGYSDGDEVDAAFMRDSGADVGVSVSVDATEIDIIQGSGPIRLHNKTTFNMFTGTSANWRWVARAWL